MLRSPVVESVLSLPAAAFVPLLPVAAAVFVSLLPAAVFVPRLKFHFGLARSARVWVPYH